MLQKARADLISKEYSSDGLLEDENGYSSDGWSEDEKEYSSDGWSESENGYIPPPSRRPLPPFPVTSNNDVIESLHKPSQNRRITTKLTLKTRG